jgi:hypothetical protein
LAPSTRWVGAAGRHAPTAGQALGLTLRSKNLSVNYLMPRWSAIGMSSRSWRAAWAGGPCKRQGREIARFRPNPKAVLFGRSAALRRLPIAGLWAAHRALHPIPKALRGTK